MGAVDRAINADAERAFVFLERLVAEPSVVGAEAPAQAVLAEELDRLGFAVGRLPIPEDIEHHDGARIPQLGYEGRDDVVGLLGPDEGRSLLVGGHIDVVPAVETGPWSSEPFVPTRRDGWLVGRGSGDMKGGFAMISLAIGALRRVAPDAIGGPLRFLSVIEEECTGNGALAACLAGQLADAVVLTEPTGLELLVAGVGILWLEISITGKAAHAQSVNKAVNPIDASIPVIGALRAFEREMNDRVDDPALEGDDHPYNVNVGAIRAGDWASSVPPIARLDVRIGHPTAWTASQAQERVRAAIEEATRDDPWLAKHPPAIRPIGFRAQGYSLAANHPLAVALADAHEAAHGVRPRALGMGSTTDARYYLNGYDTPAICYGPSATNIHGTDEAVELASIVDGARTLARFMAAWYATSGVRR
ncbi:MAG: ArgE/DapE family deacylase [Actinomycetota bacterium]